MELTSSMWLAGEESDDSGSVDVPEPSEVLDDLLRVPARHPPSDAGDEVEADEARAGAGGGQRVVKLADAAYLEEGHVETTTWS